MKKYLSLALILGLFTACNEPKEDKKAYKNEACTIGNEVFNGVEPDCKDGQVFSFQPNSWGNELRPIIITTYFCDFAYPIVQNNAGVTCIYKRRFDAPKPNQTQEKPQQENTQKEDK